ncbi:MAG: Gx transporter family protein [Spirochaetales bacterium]|nr:Gx transporter family protein [Spirochaetales bacterium]MCF7938589.1 Gx transporter family protein [Spirochaetales bacterium]
MPSNGRTGKDRGSRHSTGTDRKARNRSGTERNSLDSTRLNTGTLPTASAGHAIERIAVLAGLALALSALEYVIPKPIPFIRIGFANLPILLALDFLRPRQIFLLMLLKVLGHGLLHGTLFSYVILFSLCGSFISVLVMLAVHTAFRPRISLVGVGLFGALASNGTQLILARFVLFGSGAWLIGPPLLAVGSVSGFSLGLFAQYVRTHSAWFRLQAGEEAGEEAEEAGGEKKEAEPSNPSEGAPADRQASRGVGGRAFLRCSPEGLMLAGLLSLPAFLLNAHLFDQLAMLGLFVLLVLFFHRRVRLLPLALVAVSVVVFHLLQPFGEVLFELGSLPLTRGALNNGIERAVTLSGLVLLSRFAVRPGVSIPGKAGRLVSRMFRYFERTLERSGRFRPGSIVRELDRLLFCFETDLEPGPAGADSETAVRARENPAKAPSTKFSITRRDLICLLLPAVLWLLFFLPPFW